APQPELPYPQPGS
nr:Chain J, deamidated Gliadin-alpha2 peptide [Triticum aestivum]4OZG_I Chain I, deamidated Gliadin-alpha2 peptide [Triticum aestivum]4OZG_J Chain J, deamidated Gliadin-alpha2 peptide [Triticum aestivum]4OZH_I Chain I, Gliadin-alpha2 peptide [Triticum aestivum]4OZH_J Chain J, Gliadin-alpha2 peptide [Triticum aestivum]